LGIIGSRGLLALGVSRVVRSAFALLASPLSLLIELLLEVWELEEAFGFSVARLLAVVTDVDCTT